MRMGMETVTMDRRQEMAWTGAKADPLQCAPFSNAFGVAARSNSALQVCLERRNYACAKSEMTQHRFSGRNLLLAD